MPPPVQPRHHRSFAGPFVLILFGVVCLLATMHVISLGTLRHLFASYWPLLLIIWGVIKLIEYQQAQREGRRPPGIGAGGILLIIVIVLFGLTSTAIERFNWGELRSNMGIEDEDLKDLFGETYNYDDHITQAFPAGASLKVIDAHGAVSVHASDDNNVTVIVRKRVGAENQSDADSYNRQTKPTITAIGGLVTLDAKTEGAGEHKVESDLDISVPRKVPVSVIARHGEVTLVGRDGNVDVTAQHGDATIEDVNGSVKVSQEKGSAKIEQIKGDIHVEGRLNELSVADVKGSAQLDGEFQESVRLARISKTVTFKSSRTDMEFSRIDGSLDLDSDDLHGEEIAGPLRLMTRSKNIRLDRVSGDVRLQNDNGTVEVVMRSLGNIQIDNRNGDIQLSLPDKAGFRLDARVHDGEIRSDFPEVKITSSGNEMRASGSVGNATAHVVLNDEHDAIEIRRASASAIPAPPVPPVPAVPGKPAKALRAPREKVEPTDN
jgi:hypothetical protein